MKDINKVLSEVERVRSSAGVDRDGIYGVEKGIKQGHIKNCGQLIGELRKIDKIKGRYAEYQLEDIFGNIC